MRYLFQIPVGIDRGIAQGFRNLLTDFLQLLCIAGLLGQGAAVQCLGNGRGQIFDGKPLDPIPLVIHHAAEAEVQVGAVELEQLA